MTVGQLDSIEAVEAALRNQTIFVIALLPR